MSRERAPVSILVAPCREPGRWRARATGTDEDGTQRVCTREAWAPDAATHEALLGWRRGEDDNTNKESC